MYPWEQEGKRMGTSDMDSGWTAGFKIMSMKSNIRRYKSCQGYAWFLVGNTWYYSDDGIGI